MDRRINRVHKYAQGVRDGTIPACKMVRLAVERWFADWQRDDLCFKEEPFLRYCSMVSNLKHFKGEFAGQSIRLADWQLFIAANIFGWYRKATRARRYRYADVYVPRKNGKTTFAATIAIYLLYFDGEPAAEIYAAAVDKEQARICFETVKELIRKSPLAPLFDIYRGSVAVTKTASAFKPLTKDTKNKDGLNPHGAICDERHAWKTNEVYDVLKSGIGSRRNPLIFSISTAGKDKSFPYFQDLQYMREVIEGIHDNDDRFIMLYEPDEGDRWDDPDVWRKVNPNYGVSLYPDYMESEFKEAQARQGTTLTEFKTKLLNMWVDAPTVWIPDKDVEACCGHVSLDEMTGEPCYVGIDLAAVNDFTAAAFYFPRKRSAAFFFCVPDGKIESREDLVDYRAWRDLGWLEACPGAALDKEWFVYRLIEKMSSLNVRRICYDPWGMWDVLPKFGKYSPLLMEYKQQPRYISVPMKELERMVLTHDINISENPIIRWMFGNVVLELDKYENYLPSKSKSRNRIDGVAALINAIGSWLNQEGQKKKVIYSSHSLRTV